MIDDAGLIRHDDLQQVELQSRDGKIMGKHQGRLELTWTDKDKSLLSVGDGRYDYTFVDPGDHRAREVRLLEHVERVDHPAHVDRPEGQPAPTSENLLITGDAMHALAALGSIPEYAQHYLGKVKLVYIDPPFNTGKAFPNSYEDNIKHSVWLTMLRDRLRQIKPLLAQDGSVWVHLDDVEVHRCRAVMDEEFGEENFVAEVVWEKGDSPRMDADQFSERHDFILVYAASPTWKPNRFAPSSELTFPYVDDSDRSYRAPGPLRKWGANSQRSDRENLWYPLTAPDGTEVWPIKPNGRDGYWRWQRSVSESRADDLHWEDKGSGLQPYVKEYEEDARRPVPPETWWPNSLTGHNRKAKAEAKALFKNENPFATPKPELLLQRVIQIATSPGDVVLDCFAGSGTTVAVAHKMGRRWVGVELREENVETFTKPRLVKVVRGEDPGGITTRTTRVAVDGVDLPDGLAPQGAQEFQRTLRKIVDDADEPLARIPLDKEFSKIVRKAKKDGTTPLGEDETKMLLALVRKFAAGDVSLELDVTKQVQSQLNKATQTRDEVVTNWHGGGGFTHLRVRPSMFIEMAGTVLLADWAAHGDLTRALCAQIEVRYEPEGIFAGRNGCTRIVVIDGLVGEATVEAILDRLDESETVHVWATQADEDAAGSLASSRPGSRLSRIPDALIDQYRRAAGKPAANNEENH